MSKNEFDELLLKKLRDEELEYNPAHWDRLAQLLPPTLTPASVNKGKKWTIAAGIAAALALALATVFFVKLMNRPGTGEAAQPAVARLTEEPKNATVPGNTQPVPAIQPALTQVPQQARQTLPSAATRNGQQVAVHQHTGNNMIPNNPVVNPNPAPDNKSVLPDVLMPSTQPKETIADNKTTKEQVPVVPETLPEPRNAVQNNAAVKREPDPAYAYNNMYSGASAFYEGKHPNKDSRKTSISLGGGVNYGNLNTGYTAGISIRRKVAGDLFVDGSVAMLYNNNASNVAINNGPPLADNPSNTGAKPTAFNNETTLASPALDPIQKLYYVQFNPSIGYQVEKHVALSVGGDFQQILNSRGEQDEIVQPGTNSAKVFPNFDVGLTAKTEFSITPSIQAGLVYREGLNNLLKSDGARYVNRRYIQVQFKYNLPVN